MTVLEAFKMFFIQTLFSKIILLISARLIIKKQLKGFKLILILIQHLIFL